MTTPRTSSAAESSRDTGVYVHFPYCSKRCPYCDFAIAVRKHIPHERYRDAVLNELEARHRELAGRSLQSIYFGGGTPGLWQPDCVGAVIAAVQKNSAGLPPREITVEMNPGDLPADALLAHLVALRTAGVDRLSIGAQSFSAERLSALGRWHQPDDTRKAVAAARAAGFARLSVDLIFSLPGQTLAELDRELDQLLALGTEHVSVYCLTIEPHTAYAAYQKRGTLRVPAEDESAALYERVIVRLEAAGLPQYEISSFGASAARSIHNSLYWTGAEYLGLGSAASSLVVLPDGSRRRDKNVKQVDQYLKARARGDVTVAESETLDRDASEREAMWLGLRLVEGIDRAAHQARYGCDPVDARPDVIARLVATGWLAVDPSRVWLTRGGRLAADAVALELL